MEQKLCLITGGNAGIGKATAIGLAKLGMKVIITTRDDNKGRQAIKEIEQESGSSSISYLCVDLSSQTQIRNLADDIKSRYNKLDVLINNAGAFYSDYQESEDGIEMQFAVNHLGPFLLTNLLLDLLKAASSARVVNVASRAHYRGDIHFNDLYFKDNYDGFLKAYSQSKLANVLFTYELDRRLSDTDITVNTLHPGVISTGIAQKNASGIYKWGWRLFRPFMTGVKEGAATSIYLASSSEVEGVSGKYFDKCRSKKSSEVSYDNAVAERLWQVSEQLTGLV